MKDIDTFQFRDTGLDQRDDDHRQWIDILSFAPSDSTKTEYEYKLDDIFITTYDTSGAGVAKASMLLPAVQSVRELPAEVSYEVAVWDDFSFG